MAAKIRRAERIEVLGVFAYAVEDGVEDGGDKQGENGGEGKTEHNGHSNGGEERIGDQGDRWSTKLRPLIDPMKRRNISFWPWSCRRGQDVTT